MDDPDNTGASEAGHDLVDAEVPQARLDEGCGGFDIIEDFRIGMQMAAPFSGLRLEFGGAVQKRHSLVLGSVLVTDRPDHAIVVQECAPFN